MNKSTIQGSHYPKQFLISSSHKCQIDGWKTEEFFGIYLSRATSLPRVIVYIEGIARGFILGWFTYNGEFFFKDAKIDLHENIDTNFYLKLCGRFIIVFNTDENGVKLYTDPGALLAVVYDESDYTVASTPSIIRTYRAIEWDNDIYDNIRRFDKKIWYPFGLVPYKKIKRILPSRCFDLSTGDISSLNILNSSSTSNSVDKITRSIFNHLSNNISILATSGVLNSHLTAGYDSRMIFSSCIHAKANVKFQTIKTNSSGARIDCHIAKIICSSYNKEHENLRFYQPNTSELEAWFDRTGQCIDDTVALLCKTEKINSNNKFTLTGSCGEVGRAFYWYQDDMDKVDTPPEEIIKRMGFKSNDFILYHCSMWKELFCNNIDRTQLLDLAYIDQRLGCWAGPSVYGHYTPKPTISPFNDADVYRQLLQLPPSYRINNIFAKKFISLLDPQLTEIPFNQPHGIHRLLYPKQVIKNHVPKSIINYVKNIIKR